MKDNLKPCCVCQKRPQKDFYTAPCAACEGVWRICFTSADEGIKTAKNADVKTVRAALDFELHNSSRSRLVIALDRLLRKKGARL